MIHALTHLQQLTNNVSNETIDTVHTKLFDLMNDTYFENNENMNDNEFKMLQQMFDIFEIMIVNRDERNK